MMWGYHDGGGWWIVMWMFMFIFWAFIALGVVWVVNSMRRGDRRDVESPEELLARRLASGEIDEQQYRSLRDTLSGRTRPRSS
jgi:putative membrane protein